MNKLVTLLLCSAVLLMMLLAMPALGMTVPPAYSGKVVLHLDYGKGKNHASVDWGRDEPGRESWSGATLTAMRVVGDRFYFANGVKGSIEQYKAPGVLVCRTDPAYTDAGYYCTGPDGRIYTTGGATQERMSAFDDRGQHVWSLGDDDALPPKGVIPADKCASVQKNLGLKRIDFSLHEVFWTIDGPAVHVYATANDGRQQVDLLVLLDKNGKFKRAVRANLIAPDGTVYICTPKTKGKPARFVGVEVKAAGDPSKKVYCDLAVDNGVHLKGNAGMVWTRICENGEILIYGNADRKTKERISSHETGAFENVFWRCDPSGKLKEEWRFPMSGSMTAFSRLSPSAGTAKCITCTTATKA